jgi:hypothetical protein
MVISITSKDTNCKYEMLECKGEAKRQPSFSRGIGSLATSTNPRCGTQVTKMRVAATSQEPRRGRSLGVSVYHLRHGGAKTMYKVTKISFGLSQLLGKLRRSPRSPRSSRCCQPPRVTSLDLHLSRIQTPSMDAPTYLLNLLGSPLDLDVMA